MPTLDKRNTNTIDHKETQVVIKITVKYLEF
jgi:hypothetical protein